MRIEVKGPIIDSNQQWIYDWFEIEATSPKKVNNLIGQVESNEDLEVEINSGGGSVFAGSEIYTALKSYQGNVTVKIVGLAASAASVIAMAGDKVLISPTAQIMIHNASTYAEGDYNDMQHTADILKNISQTISNAYKLKTGKTNEELLALMDKETWLSPQQALDNGFVDEIMFNNDMQIVASINNGMLPIEVIKKMENKLLQDKHDQKIKNEKEKLLLELDLI